MKPSPHLRCHHRYRTSLAGLVWSTLLLGACSSATEPTVTLWEGTLSPTVAGGITGTVAAVSQFGRTQVSVEIRQAEAGSSYGWRIESGSCQAPGQIQGGTAVYPPLEPGEAGTASENAVIGRVFKSGSLLIARVYQTLQGGGEEVLACGSLQEQ
jgi:hypothetical protein